MNKDRETPADLPAPRSVGELFFRSVSRFDDQPAMRYRDADDWVDIRWTEFGDLVRELGVALVSLGKRNEKLLELVQDDNQPLELVELRTDQPQELV